MLTLVALLFFQWMQTLQIKETFYIVITFVEFNKYSILNWKHIYHIYINFKGYSMVVTINYLETYYLVRVAETVRVIYLSSYFNL